MMRYTILLALVLCWVALSVATTPDARGQRLIARVQGEKRKFTAVQLGNPPHTVQFTSVSRNGDGGKRANRLRVGIFPVPRVFVGRFKSTGVDGEADGWRARWLLLGAVEYEENSGAANGFTPGNDTVVRHILLRTPLVDVPKWVRTREDNVDADGFGTHEFKAVRCTNGTDTPPMCISMRCIVTSEAKELSVNTTDGVLSKVVTAPTGVQVIVEITNIAYTNANTRWAFASAIQGRKLGVSDAEVNATDSAIEADTTADTEELPLPADADADDTGKGGRFFWSRQVNCVYANGTTAPAEMKRTAVHTSWPSGANGQFENTEVAAMVAAFKAKADNEGYDDNWNTVFIIHTPMCPGQYDGMVWDPVIAADDADTTSPASALHMNVVMLALALLVAVYNLL